MNKLVRRIATAAASLAVAGGAFLTAGGSASAATLPADAPVPARAGVVAETGTTGWNHGRYDGDGSDGYRHHWSPWDRHVSGCYTYDRFCPWIWDQFEYVSHLGPQHFVNEWHHDFSSNYR
ncbi:hypothetical protein ACFV2U_31175 [Streptomyces sp. NPDC059697]|uniref:hypothetical protein n=1 Tax=Streptomyces sp. NPDC059697 TaxID=3346912 RepID=UPI00367ED8DF